MNDHRSAAASAWAAVRIASNDVSEGARAARVKFLRQHADAVYDTLTDNRTRFVRVVELADAASVRFPGLVPASRDIAAEEGLRQSQKAGLEIDQGHFISAILQSPRSGPLRRMCTSVCSRLRSSSSRRLSTGAGAPLAVRGATGRLDAGG